MGYCFNELAQSAVNPVEKKTYYLSVIKQYTRAARVLPEDDEKYCCTSSFTRHCFEVRLSV